MPKLVYLFAGQGCHYARMGQSLFESDPLFREALFRAERLTRLAGGPPLIDPIYSPSNDWVMDLTVTHPAIFAFQWAVFESLGHSGHAPDICLGASLGEYVAVSASGAADFPAMLEFVVRQSRAVVEHMPSGGMVTLLVSPHVYRQNPHLFSGCSLAAVNFDGHLVISGRRQALDASLELLREQGIPAFPLNVSFGFHSPDVRLVREPFLAAAAGIDFQVGRCELRSCCDPSARAVLKPDVEYLWRVVEQPILFEAAIRRLESCYPDAIYLDCSPSGTLANFIRYLLDKENHGRVFAVSSLGREQNRLQHLCGRLERLLERG